MLEGLFNNLRKSLSSWGYCFTDFACNDNYDIRSGSRGAKHILLKSMFLVKLATASLSIRDKKFANDISTKGSDEGVVIRGWMLNSILINRENN